MEKLILTKYFYPLKQGGTENFFGGIYFDNPRTKEEIEFVADYLKKINYSQNKRFPEKTSQVPKGSITLRWIINNIYKNNKKDPVVCEYYQEAKAIEDVYYALAKMLVIVRCDEIIDENARCNTFVIINSNNNNMKDDIPEPPLNLLNFYKIKKYLAFLSFMTSESGFFASILLNDYLEGDDLPRSYYFYNLSILVSTLKGSDKEEQQSLPYINFKVLLEKIGKYIKLVGNHYNDEKFLFICDRIKNLYDLDMSASRMCLMGLFGIIEMLLTHNPDCSMYNVEDSISKQYVKKLKYILYNNDKTLDLEKLDRKLKI